MDLWGFKVPMWQPSNKKWITDAKQLQKLWRWLFSMAHLDAAHKPTVGNNYFMHEREFMRLDNLSSLHVAVVLFFAINNYR